MTLVYLDTETTGLDPSRHEIWEAAYAVGPEGEIESSLLIHTLVGADPSGLRIGNYRDRCMRQAFYPQESLDFERDLRQVLDGATLVGANPAFDARFLEARWGVAPWRYRLLDIETYAMGALGYDEPQGLARIAADLRDVEARFPADYGFDIPEPDHTAGGDVATLRACHHALQTIYSDRG